MIKYRSFNLWTQNETSLLMNKIFFSGYRKDITYEIPRKWDFRLSSFQSLGNLLLLYYLTSMLCLYSKVKKISYKRIPPKLPRDSTNINKSIFLYLLILKSAYKEIGINMTFLYIYLIILCSYSIPSLMAIPTALYPSADPLGSNCLLLSCYMYSIVSFLSLHQPFKIFFFLKYF